MNLRTATTALATAAGALLLGAAGPAQAAQTAPPSPQTPASSGDGVALVKKDEVTPWSLTDFLLGTGD
ncbi:MULTISPECIES: hypothetical protein [Streptomyces]|uniref:Uncharacterized protein n=1 Tax=Streptomyces fradiae ATCC 10745 = DSM 40063 TaxID=1319510 RepID=A0A1Y2P2L5_STRFR|nr:MULTISPECIES: hypothetical protein [Streptomyces]KAF0647588.1 hypothetical protein K701_22725 [Streptomyces fradiae ATCC 10745 = DSM 40063]OSY54045.1 hypothetical protein BG846_00282 [Streptomyces fradiae ATCC 10745 = DSM 40063]QEV15327.1 hypothetical protein CP974_29020 [Streptomyces fradiae ATCC 10745 = DSM 40063]